MTKREWMLLALALIIGSLILISSLLVMFWVQHRQSLKEKQVAEEVVNIEETTYEIIEEDQWFKILRRFKERYNVLEVAEAHDAIQPQIDRMLQEGMPADAIQVELRFLVEAYVQKQTREVAHEVLMEYVEGYSKWDMEYLLEHADNAEKIEVFYLLELKYLESQQRGDE